MSPGTTRKLPRGLLSDGMKPFPRFSICCQIVVFSIIPPKACLISLIEILDVSFPINVKTGGT